jgi:hypothetical protein
MQHPAVPDSAREARQQRRVRDRIEVLREIGVHHFSSPVIHSFVDGTNRLVRAPTGTVSIRRLVEVRFEDRFDHQLRRGLHHPIADHRPRRRRKWWADSSG